MELTNVKIDVTGTGTGRIELDGHDVSNIVAGFTLNSQVGDMTTLLLRVRCPRGVEVDAELGVVIPEPLAVVLKAAGWTPPEDGRG